MANGSNKKLKLLYIAELLMRKSDEDHPLTLKDISQYLEEKGIKAERKSLYDDIALLRKFGLDIIGIKTKHFVYYLAGRDFEDVELKLLVDAVQSSRFITKRKSEELIRKIERLTSEYGASLMDRQVYVTNRVKNLNESIYYNVDKIHHAIGADMSISFKYFDWTTGKEKRLRHNGELYHVSPWALSWSDEYYYLIAFDIKSAMIKHYRVDRMMYISETEKGRKGAEAFNEFDLPLYSKQFFGMFGGRSEKITLECASELAGVIIDRFGHDVNIYDDNGKTFKVKEDIAVSEMFFGWIMSFGDKMKIISPDEVRRSVRKYAEGILKQYED